MLLHEEDAKKMLLQFPEVQFAFAYGSGAIQQGGYKYTATGAQQKLPMLDLVLVVEDATAWHADNMHRNPSHYSPILPVSSSTVAFIQEAMPAHFWFNTDVPMLPDRCDVQQLMQCTCITAIQHYISN